MKLGEQVGKGVNEVIDGWNNREYKIERFGQNPSVIVLGENHSALDNIRKQFELVSILMPQCVLYEPMGGWEIDPDTKLLIKQKGRAFAEGTFDENPKKRNPKGFAWWIQFADMKHFRMIGCDLTMAECREKAKELNLYLPDDILMRDDRIMSFRNEHMVKWMAIYQEKFPAPVIAVIGAAHSNSISRRQLLQDKGIEYIHIDQTTMYGGMYPFITEY